MICTRDRGDKILDTIASILDGKCSDIEILIIDQSAGDDTAKAVATVQSDPASATCGPPTSESAARAPWRWSSLAPSSCQHDDDCIVCPDWCGRQRRCLASNPSVGIVFGDVESPDDVAPGFAPESVATRDFTVRSIWGWRTASDGVNVGIGASMAMRRTALLAAGPFDSELGPGSRFKNAEDTDMTLRVLMGGWHLMHCREAASTTTASLPRGVPPAHARRHDGLGAMTSKHVRRHPLAAGGRDGAAVAHGRPRRHRRPGPPAAPARAVASSTSPRGSCPGCAVPLKRGTPCCSPRRTKRAADDTNVPTPGAVRHGAAGGLRTYSEN